MIVVLQTSWNFDCYCEQCVFVLCFICRSWSWRCWSWSRQTWSWHCWSWLQNCLHCICLHKVHFHSFYSLHLAISFIFRVLFLFTLTYWIWFNTNLLNVFACRDPNLQQTLDRFAASAVWAANGEFTDRDIDEAKLAVFSQVASWLISLLLTSPWML